MIYNVNVLSEMRRRPGVVLMSKPGTANRGTTPSHELPSAVIVQEAPSLPTFLENAAFIIWEANAGVTTEARNWPEAIDWDKVAFPAENTAL
jgi:hypothetical protein